MNQREAGCYARESWPDYSCVLRGPALKLTLWFPGDPEPTAEAQGKDWEEVLFRMHHQMDQIPEN